MIKIFDRLYKIWNDLHPIAAAILCVILELIISFIIVLIIIAIDKLFYV
jgi:hypothetical protein